MELSRRNFVTAAAGVAAGTAAVAALTSTPAHADEAAATASADSSSDWLGEAPVIADSDIVETVQTDVLVVGDGCGGIFAAASAAEEGVKVLVIEKGDYGYGIRGDLGAINSKLAISGGVEYDPCEITKDICEYANYDCDMVLVKLWADKSGEVLDWFQDVQAQYGNVEYLETYEGTPGTEHKYWATGHNNDGDIDDAMHEYVESLGGEFRNNTALIELITENGAVTGAIAEGKDGYIRIETSLGVIIATGGYARNDDMMRALQPDTCRHYSFHQAPITNTGDGIKACLWAGAVMQEEHGSMLFDRCALPTDGVSGLDHIDDGCLFWMGSQPFMKVDLYGKRFANESCPYDYILHASSNHPGNCYCTIWDANYEEHMRQFDTLGCSRPYPIHCWDGENEFDSIASMDGMGMIQLSLGLAEDAGYLQQADTFEELAEKLNIPVDNFVEQVNMYNEMCDAGEDTQFGKESYRMIKLDTPPYYGVRQTGMLLCTLDGICINDKMQALDADCNPIEGLYVIGNDSGNYYAHTYTNTLSGGAAGRTVTFGRIAGKQICGSEL